MYVHTYEVKLTVINCYTRGCLSVTAVSRLSKGILSATPSAACASDSAPLVGYPPWMQLWFVLRMAPENIKQPRMLPSAHHHQAVAVYGAGLRLKSSTIFLVR